MSILNDLFTPTKILKLDMLSIYKDTSGILKAKMQGEKEEYSVRLIRCFPYTDPDHYLSLSKIGVDEIFEEEIGIISDYKKLDESSKKVIEENLKKSYFIEQITSIYSIKQKGKVWRWNVETDRGRRIFEVRSLRDICIFPSSNIIIKDINRNRFQINPVDKLDSKSRVLLEQYI